MAIILPSAADAALQTPLNTFSPTSTPLQNTVNGLTYNYNQVLGIWTSAATGSGLAAASLADAAAGVLTSVYSSPQTAVPKSGSGMTGSAYLPAGNTAARPAANAYIGQFRYNTQIPQLEYSDGVSWIAAGAQAATLAEAAAGTLTTKYLSPETGVPKNGSGMAGAALIPGGNDAARPSPVTGMFRYNNQSGTPVRLEYYDGAAWSPVGSTAGLGLVLDGSALKVSLPVASTPPAVGGGVAQAVNGSMYWDDTLGQLFIRYINSGNPAWVAAAPPSGGGGGAGTWTTFTSSGTWTKPAGVSTVYAYVVGGGGGAKAFPGGNGGGGAGVFHTFDASTVPASVAITVGAGGAAGGGAGGTSSVGTFISAPGGGGSNGAGGGSIYGGGAPGYPVGQGYVGPQPGYAFTGGGPGDTGVVAGSSWFGGGGGANTVGGGGGGSGDSRFAGDGGFGSAGSIPGGGGGMILNQTPFAGGRGEVRILAF